MGRFGGPERYLKARERDGSRTIRSSAETRTT